ncbi:autophagy protein 16- interacts with Atg12p-Atg5p [Apiospora rasikravindrae]|uniref:Autophagy protein 16- interacts with Atg12p-Atg5p n=1 Tax=Apiospora rasikravindrae TaxID=990691 RepID=A0ABR1T5H5_9PEZI
MPDWRDEYLVNLQEAERANPVNRDLVAASAPSSPKPAADDNPAGATDPAATAASASTPNTAQLKLDLAEALRAKGQLQSKLKTSTTELQKLRAKSKVDDKRVHDLTAERNTLATKLKDRNEELVGKTKLLKEVQDDNLTLNIQIDVTEQKAAKVAAENEELVDRWMKRMAQEADAMNLSNEPRHRSGR